MMRRARAHAEHQSSIQAPSDAQSAAVLQTELNAAWASLKAETAECRAAIQRHAEATAEHTAQIKFMSSRFKDKFEERERALQHEIAVQKDLVRQLQLKADSKTATSSRVPPKARADIDCLDLQRGSNK